jgi:hypothetical protein
MGEPEMVSSLQENTDVGEGTNKQGLTLAISKQG